MKKKIKKVLKSIKKYVESSVLTKRIKRIKRRITRKRKENEKINVLVLAQFPEMWNSEHSLCESFLGNGNFALTILSIPKHKYNGSTDFKDDDPFGDCNEMYDFLKSKGIKSVNARLGDKWVDFKSFKPDIIFIQRPYLLTYPKQYSFKKLSKEGLVCYIPYDGVDLSANIHTSIMLNADLLRNCSYFFTALPEQDEYFNQNKYSGLSKSFLVGSPRIDLIKTSIANASLNKKTALWLPRWYVGKSKNNNKSNFLRYIHQLVGFFKEHKDLTLIIRPHPLLFDAIVQEGIMTQNEVDDLKKTIINTGNISFDNNKDYFEGFNQSDILISDFTSLLYEYFFTNKPIIYCGERGIFNKIGDQIAATYYNADNEEELLGWLNKLFYEAEDSSSVQIRESIIREYLNSEAKVSDIIIDTLLKEI